jgi:hypothetical protein
MDFVQGETGNRYVAIDLPSTNIAANTFTFATGSIPSDLQVGDYMTLSGESPVLQIPEEAKPYLQTCTAYDALYSISDFEGQKALEAKMKDQREMLLKLLEPRVEGEAEIIINDRGLLRNNRMGRRNMGYLWSV